MPSIAVSTAKETLQVIANKFAMLPAKLISSQNPSAMATYAALDIFASTGESPSLANISRVTGLARPTIRRARDWLVQNGYIEVAVTGTGRTPSRYTLLGMRGNDSLPQGEQIVTPSGIRGNDSLPQGEQIVTPPTPETDAETSNSNSNSNSNSIKSISNKVTNNAPQWFAPLTTLEGYKNRNYQKSIVAIEQICSNNGVQPTDVVQEFVDYYPIGHASRGWKDPVPALLRTLIVQVGKVQAKGKGTKRVSTNAMTLEEEIAFQRDTGIRPSSVQADTIRADWLKKYREQ
jgi:hypothetical protein